MQIRTLILAGGLASLGLSSFGLDSDTLAVYTFTEKANGEAANEGLAIANGVGGASHAGTVVKVGTPNANDKLLFDAVDVPGKYVFETNVFGAVAVITNAQALAWSRTDNTGTARGLSIDFADIGNTLSGLDEWTLEFFAAWPAESKGLHTAYNGNVFFNAGASLDGTTTVGTSLTVGISQSNTLIWNGAPGSVWTHYGTSNFATLRYGDGNSLNGQWHHIALVYRRSTGKYQCYYDYARSAYSIASLGGKTSYKELSCTALPVSESSPLQIGLGRMIGKVFCPRVTKRALAPDQFLHASNDPEYLPRTVFHLAFEGTPGDSPTVFTNVASSATAFANQYIGANFVGQTLPFGLTWNGNGKVYVPTTVTADPVLTNCVMKRIGGITDGKGGTRLGPDTTSLLTDCNENTTTNKDFRAAGRVPYVASTDYPLVIRGSFTMEGFVKLDYKRFLARSHIIDTYEKGETATYSRFTLFGVDLGDGADVSFGMQYYHQYKKWCILCSSWEKNEDGTRRIAAGGGVWSRQFKGGYNNVLLDDKWHHVALVYDDTTRRITGYVDYKQQFTDTYNYNFVFGGGYNANFYIGGQINGQAMPGCYDHFRYSRVALQPDQFLHCVYEGGMLLLVR